MSSCKKRVQGGDYYCAACGVTWGRRDPNPPPCKQVKDQKVNDLSELRELLEREKHADQS